MHSEMHPVWQNPIQRTVRTAHLVCLWLCTTVVYNTAQNSSDNLPSYLQTNTIAQMLSIRGEGAVSKRQHSMMSNIHLKPRLRPWPRPRPPRRGTSWLSTVGGIMLSPSSGSAVFRLQTTDDQQKLKTRNNDRNMWQCIIKHFQNY